MIAVAVLVTFWIVTGVGLLLPNTGGAIPSPLTSMFAHGCILSSEL